MKKFIFTMIAAVGLMTSCINGKTVSIEREFQAQEFSSINMKGVGTIVYTQAPTCSVRAKGDSVLIENTTITFSEGCLTIVQKNESKNGTDGATFYVTSPSLTCVNTDGVGSFEAEQPIAFENDFTFEMDGVGAVKFADLACKNLTFRQSGVGAAEVKVKCNTAKYHNEGVGAGKIEIEADTLFLDNDGVGAVKVKGHVRNYQSHSGGITSKISDGDLKVNE